MSLPIGSVEQILAKAPADAREDLVEIPEWGCSVKIRTLTAGQLANMKSAASKVDGRGKVHTDIAAMERVQFQSGVIEPQFSQSDVMRLQATSSTGFTRVIERIDKLQGGDEKEIFDAAVASFPERPE